MRTMQALIKTMLNRVRRRFILNSCSFGQDNMGTARAPSNDARINCVWGPSYHETPWMISLSMYELWSCGLINSRHALAIPQQNVQQKTNMQFQCKMKNTSPFVIVEIGMIKKQRKRREHTRRKSYNLTARVFQNSCKSKVLLGTKEAL